MLIITIDKMMSKQKITTKTEDDNNRVKDVSVECNVTKEFDTILKDIKNNGRTTKSISVKSCSNNINLQPVIYNHVDFMKHSIFLMK